MRIKSDPRHFAYFRCPDCKGAWRVWEPHSYDAEDLHPQYTEMLCDECTDERAFQEQEV